MEAARILPVVNPIEFGNGFYLLHMWPKRAEMSELLNEVKHLAEQWKARYILVEDAGSGISLAQLLKHETPLNVISVKPSGDKQERAAMVTPEFESGKVFLP